MLGTSKRNLFSANYAMLVITEMTVERDSGDRQVPSVQAQVKHLAKELNDSVTLSSSWFSSDSDSAKTC